jgi:Tfp pilus assembly protein PilX
MSSRKGFALLASLFAILLIAALVSSVFLAASEESRIGGAAATKEAALFAAEAAIELTVSDSSSLVGDSIDLGVVRSSTKEAYGTPVSVSVTRLDSTLYAIVAEARSVSSQSSATRRVGAIVRARVAADHSITIDRVPQRWWSELF